MTRIEAVCSALCKSGKFETGEGTCALICMDQLGNARDNCSHRGKIHGKLAASIILALGQIEVVS